MDVLELRNFKAFARLELRLAPLTILSGINAVGKSTVLQALALLRQSHESVLLGETGLLLNGNLVEPGTGRDVLHEDYESDGGKPIISIAVTESGSHYTWVFDYGPDRDLLALAGGPGGSSTNLSLFNPGFQYLRADRIGPSVYFPKSYQDAVLRQFLGVRGEHTANYLRTHGDERVLAGGLTHPRAKSTSVLDQTTAWLQDLCPGVDVQAADLEGTDFARLDYGFFGTAGIRASNRYRPTNVGFGLTYVLPVVVACVAAGPGSLIMIENPEAHLHPQGQTAMGYLVSGAAAAGAQLLVESHSDHVLNGVRLAVKAGTIAPLSVALHFFHRSGDGKIASVQPEIGPDGMLSTWPDGFFDEWDRTLDQLLD